MPPTSSCMTWSAGRKRAAFRSTDLPRHARLAGFALLQPGNDSLSTPTEAETNVCIMDTHTGQALKTLQHADQVWEVAWYTDGVWQPAASTKASISGIPSAESGSGCGAPNRASVWDSVTRVTSWPPPAGMLTRVCGTSAVASK